MGRGEVAAWVCFRHEEGRAAVVQQLASKTSSNDQFFILSLFILAPHLHEARSSSATRASIGRDSGPA